MKRVMSAGWVLAAVIVGSGACTSILGGFDYNGKTSASGSGGMSTSNTAGSGGVSTSNASTGSGGAGGMSTSSASVGSGGSGGHGCVNPMTDCLPSAMQCLVPICVAGACSIGPASPKSCVGGVCGDPAGPKAGLCVPCNVDGDCSNGKCLSNVCYANTCFDGMTDGSETDVDCGGASCPSCAFGKQCGMDDDCASGYCGGAQGCDACTVTSMQMGPTGIAVDATNIYWVNNTGGTVYEAAKACGHGGVVVDQLATMQQNPFGPVIDANNVYWVDLGAQPSPLLMSAAINSSLMPTSIGAADVAVGLAIFGNDIYMPDGVGMLALSTIGQHGILALQGTHPYAVAVDANHVYATDATDGTVVQLDSPLVTLATDQQTPKGIAVDAHNVYWTTYDGGTVMQTQIGGGAQLALIQLASGQTNPLSIATDGVNVYWANADSIMKVAVGGNTPILLASGQAPGGAIALDDTNVYWTNPTLGTVMTLLK